MRTWSLVFIAATGLAQAAPYVNLDQPGAFETLARDNPRHYAIVTQLIEIAQASTCDELPAVLKAGSEVSQLSCSAHLFKTSLPPKQHLFFMLDGVGYAKNVVQYNLSEPRLRRVK